MKREIIMAVITFILGGGLGAYLQTIFSYKKEIAANIWAKRFEQYKIIWEISGILPKYPQDTNVTYKQIHEACIKIKDWYFQNGGIILSRQSRKSYENLQKTISEINTTRYEEKLSDPDYTKIQNLFSSFRSKLTGDLTSRNKSI
jgi:hypothetical protein